MKFVFLIFTFGFYAVAFAEVNKDLVLSKNLGTLTGMSMAYPNTACSLRIEAVTYTWPDDPVPASDFKITLTGAGRTFVLQGEFLTGMAPSPEKNKVRIITWISDPKVFGKKDMHIFDFNYDPSTLKLVGAQYGYKYGDPINGCKFN